MPEVAKPKPDAASEVAPPRKLADAPVREVLKSFGMSRKEAAATSRIIGDWLAQGIQEGYRPALVRLMPDGKLEISSIELKFEEGTHKKIREKDSKSSSSGI